MKKIKFTRKEKGKNVWDHKLMAPLQVILSSPVSEISYISEDGGEKSFNVKLLRLSVECEKYQGGYRFTPETVDKILELFNSHRCLGISGGEGKREKVYDIYQYEE